MNISVNHGNLMLVFALINRKKRNYSLTLTHHRLCVSLCAYKMLQACTVDRRLVDTFCGGQRH